MVYNNYRDPLLIIYGFGNKNKITNFDLQNRYIQYYIDEKTIITVIGFFRF